MSRMNRLANTFQALSAEKKTALIPYVTAGDPNQAVTVPLMHAMVASGANIIELGIPFSDPMADGPVIQAACERALAAKTSLQTVLEMVSQFRKSDQDTPVVLMGYTNPVEAMGYTNFANSAKQAGVDGVLMVDTPPEEANEFLSLLKSNGIDPIFLLSPTTTDQRIQKICAASAGFIYYVSLKGVTGASTLDIEEVSAKLQHIRQYTNLPLGVGFGIKNAESAAAVAGVADAVVVGSALVNCLASNLDQPQKAVDEISSILVSMRKAMDAVS